MPLPQIVPLSGINGRSLFKVWDADTEAFLSLEGQDQWTDWNQFKGNLRQYWNANLDNGGTHSDQRFWEYLQRYERSAPTYLKSPSTPADAQSREKKTTRELWLTGGVLLFSVIVIGSVFWEQGMAPVLGRLGVLLRIT